MGVVLLNPYRHAAPAAPFDFATMFTKGAFDVDAITPVADGTAVSPWVDASALATNLVFDPGWGAGTTPIYKTTGLAKPVLRATGTNTYIRSLPAIAQPFTVLWIGRVTSASGSNSLWQSTPVRMYLGGSMTTLYIDAGLSQRATVPDLSVGNHYILAVFDGNSSVLRVDGVAKTLIGDGNPLNDVGTGALSGTSGLPTSSHAANSGPDLRAFGLAPIHPSGAQITAIEAWAAGKV